MTNINLLIDQEGTWKGKYSLWKTPDDIPDISDSELTIKPILKSNFVSFDYSWTLDGISHEGSIVIGFEKKRLLLSSTWIDTWHMKDKHMFNQGLVDENGSFVFRGFYEVPEGPDWGWKTIIEISNKISIRITMYNVTPEGKEHLAVKSTYKFLKV